MGKRTAIPKSRFHGFRLTDSQDRELREMAKEKGISVSEFCFNKIFGGSVTLRRSVGMVESVEIMRRLDQLDRKLDQILGLVKRTHNNTL